jgi:uncharacterized OsmC-like protein
MSLDTLIADTRQAIADDAANAHAVFSAQGTLVGVTEVDVSTGAHTFKVDEPPVLGGGDAAANPVQYALASLGSCQAITYRFWAAHLGVELDSITVRVEGDLDLRGFFGVDDAVRPGFTAVRVEVSLAGPESEERYAQLAAAVDEHCPVLDLFKNPCRCPARSSPPAEAPPRPGSGSGASPATARCRRSDGLGQRSPQAGM